MITNFSLDSFRITDTRSRHEDTDFINHNEVQVRPTTSPRSLKVRTNLRAGKIAVNHNQALVRPVHMLKVRTNVRAGGIRLGNHNEAQVHSTTSPRSLKVRTNVRAGKIALNHNQALVRPVRMLKVRTKVRAGGENLNHNEALLRPPSGSTA